MLNSPLDWLALARFSDDGRSNEELATPSEASVSVSQNKTFVAE
jgi:hypothetical protein